MHVLQKATAERRLANAKLTLDESMHPLLEKIEHFGKGKYNGCIMAHSIRHEELKWPKGTVKIVAKAGHEFRGNFKPTAKERTDFIAAVEKTHKKPVANPTTEDPTRLLNSAWHAIDNATGKKVLFVDNEFLRQQQPTITALQFDKYQKALNESQKK